MKSLSFSLFTDDKNPVFMNESLCIYCKKLYAKCKKLQNNKLIYVFQIIQWIMDLFFYYEGDM